MAAARQRRVLSLWLPRFSSDRALRRAPVTGPFAMIETVAGSDRLACASTEAVARGLRPGLLLTEARALCPDLLTRPVDHAADAQALAVLRRWALRYCPWVAREGRDGLVMDLTGAAHLMGGEAALMDDLLTRLARAGMDARAGLADTRGAAWALARFGCRQIAVPGQGAAALGPLPLAALRLDPDTVAGLERMGLRRIGDLTGLPRAALTRRFGRDVVRRLDQALGALPEPVTPEAEPPHFGVRMSFPDPIGLRGDIEAALARLLDRLCARLAAAGQGARQLRLELLRSDASRAEVELGLARPMRDPQAMAALFVHALDNVDAGFGIDRVRLTAPLTEPLPSEQTEVRGMGDVTAAQGADALAGLLTRLGNRVGFDNLQRFLPAESHIPETGFQIASAVFAKASGQWPIGPPRPLLMFDPEPLADPLALRDAGKGGDIRGALPPRRFVWRRQALWLARASGPERIAPEWWFDAPQWRSGVRDYWQLETQQGPRLWLFHTPRTGAWAVQGLLA